jgi:hypothetical protein
MNAHASFPSSFILSLHLFPEFPSDRMPHRANQSSFIASKAVISSSFCFTYQHAMHAQTQNLLCEDLH